MQEGTVSIPLLLSGSTAIAAVVGGLCSVLITIFGVGRQTGDIKARIKAIEDWKEEHDPWSKNRESALGTEIQRLEVGRSMNYQAISDLTKTVDKVHGDVQSIIEASKETNEKLDNLVGQFTMYLEITQKGKRK